VYTDGLMQSLAQEKCIVNVQACLACLLCKGAEGLFLPASVTFSLLKQENIFSRRSAKPVILEKSGLYHRFQFKNRSLVKEIKVTLLPVVFELWCFLGLC